MEVNGQLHAPAALLPVKELTVLIGDEAGCQILRYIDSQGIVLVLKTLIQSVNSLFCEKEPPLCKRNN